MEMVKNSKKEDAQNANAIRSRWSIVLVLVLIAGAIFIVWTVINLYWTHFGDLFATAHDSIIRSGGNTVELKAQWGQFGDFVGGVSNPIIGVFTVVLLGFTFLAQRLQLVQARSELKATQEIQKSTEIALHNQTSLLRHDSEINLALKLIDTYDQQISKLKVQSLTDPDDTERDQKLASLELKVGALVHLLDQRFDNLIDVMTSVKKGAIPMSGEHNGLTYSITYDSFSNTARSVIKNSENDELRSYSFPGENFGDFLERRSWALHRAFSGTGGNIKSFAETGVWPESNYAGVPQYALDSRIHELGQRAYSLLTEIETIAAQLKALAPHFFEGEGILQEIKSRLQKAL